MKRKFFSALLLMTLSVASVGMFVSCKDYDDDINGVRDDVTNLRSELETAKADLETQLTQAKGDFAAQIQTATENKADKSYVDDLNAQRIAAETKLQEQIDAVNSALEGLGAGDIQEAIATLAAVTGRLDGVEDKVAAVEKNLEIQQRALAAFLENIQDAGFDNAEELVAAVKDAQGKISSIQSEVSSNGSDIATLKGLMSDAEEALGTLDKTVNGLKGQIDALTVLVDKMLSSLVFAPDFYYGGIEAMEATTIDYTPVLLKKDSPAKNPLATGETWDFATAENHLTPDVVANYHMNPSYFDVKRIKSMSVVSDDKEYIQLGSTRAAAASAPSVVDKSWLNSKDGMLSVTLNLDASKIVSDADHVTVLAVQAHMNDAEGNDTTVTSDYAAIAKSTINNIKIADPKLGGSSCTAGKKFHIYTTAQQAISNNATHEIVYNDPEGVDLMELVQMHFTRNNNATETSTDDVSKYGMKWEFAESHYTAGSNKTSESAHIYLKNNRVIACTVDADGNAQPGTQDRSSIDRKPMVRVTLVDTTKTTNNIVAVGFIKFTIVDEKAEPEDDKNIEFDGKGYDLSCDAFNYTQTWAEVENKVLSELNMSKAEFEANYTVEKTSAGATTCQLYSRNAAGKPSKASEFGSVEEKVDPNNHETTVLSWTVPAADIYAEVWDAAKGAYKTGVNLETGVRFVSKDATKPDVYVWFHTGVITTPKAVLDNSDKIAENWAATNSALKTGFDEIHNNVEVVGQPNADDEFSQDILRTFVGNDITLDITGSDAFKNNLDYMFKFIITDEYKTQVGQSGKSYTLSVSATGKTLYANFNGVQQELARLGRSFDDVTSAQNIISVVQYADTEFAKDLLNAVSHNNIAKTVTATVGIFVQNECGMELPVENGTFDIKFLRPLDVEGGKAITFTDAVTGGNKKDMAELVNFKDWRDVKWEEGWISYYGVTKIEAETSEITTTLNGGKLGETKLSDVTKGVEFKYYSTGASKTYGGVDFGYLYYGNNGSVTATFQIRVPLTVTYDWGEITTSYVDITVEPTIVGKAARR